MDCREVRDRIQDLLDDRLPADDRGRVEGHLETCAACAKERDELVRTIALIRSLPRETAPAGFASDVLAATATRSTPRGRRLYFPLTLLASVAAAALILVAVVVFVPGGEPGPGDETRIADRKDEEVSPSVVRDSEDDGYVDARRPPKSPEADRLEKDALGFAFRPADRIFEVRVENPRAVEGRLRALLSLSLSELEAEPKAEEKLARERAARQEAGAPVPAGGRAGGGAGASTGAGERPPVPAAPSPAPAAERAPGRTPDEPRVAGDGPDADGGRAREAEEQARKAANRRSARTAGTSRDVVLTRDQLTRLLAALDPEGRGGPVADEAKERDLAEEVGAPTPSKKAKATEADARAVLLALRALRNLDGQQPVRVRLLGRSPVEAAGR